MRLSRIHRILLVAIVLGGTASSALGQFPLTWPVNKPPNNPAPIQPAPPMDYDKPIGLGKVTDYEYTSKTQGGIKRPVRVYTPPGYTPTKAYPVLYLMHGLGGAYTDWTVLGKAQNILDRLLVAGKIVPMIVVMPDNNASTKAVDPVQAAYREFEAELLNDLIPFIDGSFSTIRSPQGRSLAGLSEGAEQAVKFGLEHLDTFSRIGAFSPGQDLGTGLKDQTNFFVPPDPIPNVSNLRLFYLSCGNDDPSHYQACHNLVRLLNASSSLNVPVPWKIRVVKLGDPQSIPLSGEKLIVIGHGPQVPLAEQVSLVKIFDASGKLVIDKSGTQLTLKQSSGIAAIVLEVNAAPIQAIREVSSLMSYPIPVVKTDLEVFVGPHAFSVWSPSLYYFLQDIFQN
jgi:enterochelin esterase-like enzyme